MSWSIPDWIFGLMVFFDCLGIAFSFFVTLFILNYFLCGFTSKVDDDSKSVKILKRARTGVDSVKSFVWRKSSKTKSLHLIGDDVSVPPKVTDDTKVGERCDVLRCISVESASSLSEESSITKSSLKKRSPTNSTSQDADDNLTTDDDKIHRKTSVKRVSFGINDFSNYIHQMERRRFNSDSKVMECQQRNDDSEELSDNVFSGDIRRSRSLIEHSKSFEKNRQERVDVYNERRRKSAGLYFEVLFNSMQLNTIKW